MASPSSKKEEEHASTFGSVPNSKTTGIHPSHYIDRNAMINIILLSISFYGYFFSSYPWILSFTWIGFLFFEDFLFFYFGKSIFCSEIGVKRGYQFAHIFLENTSGHGRDLGFNLYDGNLNKTYKESQIDKFKYVSSHLGLKPGMKLLDVGCGYGDWLNWAKNSLKLSECVGVNISPEQAAFAQNQYGLEIYNNNWKDILSDPVLQKKLFDRFDVITFYDTVEHYVSSKDRNNEKAQEKIYGDMFKMAHLCMDKKSSLQKVFISCLHQNDMLGKNGNNWSFGIKGKISSYFLVRYHSGYYPKGSRGCIKYADKYFNTISMSDKTEDYRLTAVLDNSQFQAPKISFSLRNVGYALVLFLIDPHHLHKWIDIWFDCWMNLYGDDVYSKEYNVEKRAKSSLVLLWWITLQSKSIKK